MTENTERAAEPRVLELRPGIIAFCSQSEADTEAITAYNSLSEELKNAVNAERYANIVSRLPADERPSVHERVQARLANQAAPRSPPVPWPDRQRASEVYRQAAEVFARCLSVANNMIATGSLELVLWPSTFDKQPIVIDAARWTDEGLSLKGDLLGITVWGAIGPRGPGKGFYYRLRLRGQPGAKSPGAPQLPPPSQAKATEKEVAQWIFDCAAENQAAGLPKRNKGEWCKHAMNEFGSRCTQNLVKRAFEHANKLDGAYLKKGHE